MGGHHYPSRWKVQRGRLLDVFVALAFGSQHGDVGAVELGARQLEAIAHPLTRAVGIDRDRRKPIDCVEYLDDVVVMHRGVRSLD